MTASRLAESRHDRPTWSGDEFWRCWCSIPDGLPGTPGSSPCPVLPDDFWETGSHPFLAHTRQAALSVESVPDAMLHAVLADVATLTHYDWYLPGNRRGTLDMLLCIVGRSGDGKGTATDGADNPGSPGPAAPGRPAGLARPARLETDRVASAARPRPVLARNQDKGPPGGPPGSPGE